MTAQSGRTQVAPSRLAALDVGTNSIRCIIAESTGDGSFRILDDEKAQVRLGEGLLQSGVISSAAWERAAEALGRMRKIIDGMGVSAVAAVATSAVRSASNGVEFTRSMKRKTGISIRTISVEEEAELAALSVRQNFNMEGRRYAVVDIGGGSVEVVVAAGNHNEEIYSLELGAVVLTEKYLRRDPIPNKDFVRLRRRVRRRIKEAMDDSRPVLPGIVGSGGTMTTIGSMVMASRGEHYNSIHGYEVLHSDVVHLLATLRHRGGRERQSLPGLSPERADIIVAGVTVVERLMRHFGANVLTVNERGIREGLILKSLREQGLADNTGEKRDWRGAVRNFAGSCHIDEHHADQVVSLSLALHDAVSRRYDLGHRSREMLEAAAILHDTGYWISYPRHHKHSYHLIRHADLYDFPREREIIANVARYHRRAMPKKKHENFAVLSPADRDVVKKLGGILRLADGLDRRRIQAVKGLRGYFRKGAFFVRISGRRDLNVEIHGGRVKGDLFENAFGLRLSVSVEPQK